MSNDEDLRALRCAYWALTTINASKDWTDTVELLAGRIVVAREQVIPDRRDLGALRAAEDLLEQVGDRSPERRALQRLIARGRRRGWR